MADADGPNGDSAGHRSVPDGTGRVIEAWGPDAAACLTEALAALIEGFAEVADAPAARVLPLSVAKGPEDALTSLVEEVIDTMDTFSVVPVRFHLTGTEGRRLRRGHGGGPDGGAQLTGTRPTAVSFEGLSMAAVEGGWFCHVRVELSRGPPGSERCSVGDAAVLQGHHAVGG